MKAKRHFDCNGKVVNPGEEITKEHLDKFGNLVHELHAAGCIELEKGEALPKLKEEVKPSEADAKKGK